VAAEKIALLLVLFSFIAFLSGRSLRSTGRQSMSHELTARWSELDISGLRSGFRDNMSLSDIAAYLFRTEEDVSQKARELGISLRTA
jgi:hypothetical protein